MDLKTYIELVRCTEFLKGAASECSDCEWAARMLEIGKRINDAIDNELPYELRSK